MKETILQFGTGAFLRAFTESFVDKLNKDSLYDGKIVAVQSTPSGRAKLINQCGGQYPLILRGVENGQIVDALESVQSLARAIDISEDFYEFLTIARAPELRFIVSNTTEAGIVYSETDSFEDSPPHSFPAKITRLLWERFQSGNAGLVFLPCELVEDNGERLKEFVLRTAARWQLPVQFAAWVDGENHFCNTLVDRIVTGRPTGGANVDGGHLDDKLLDVAEPYYLWAIEGDYEAELPFRHAGLNVIWCDDVSPYRTVKVRVLNGCHTAMAMVGLLCGITTVGEAMSDPDMSVYIKRCLDGEILPSLAPLNCENYAKAVMERFKNPFLKHKLSSIALNSVSKYSARILPSVKAFNATNSAPPSGLTFALAALITFYKNAGEKTVCDAPQTCEKLKKDVGDILADTSLWGEDISFLCDVTMKHMHRIETLGVRRALKFED